MTSITQLAVHAREGDPLAAIVALKAAFTPFASLSGGEAFKDDLAQAMLSYVQAREPEARVQCGTRVLACAHATDADEVSEVCLSPWNAALRTPTSKTEIRLQAYAGGFAVSVIFGTAGSITRAGQILERAHAMGVDFEAWEGALRLDAAALRALLVERARKNLEWLEGLPAGYYPPEILAERLAHARQAVTGLA